MTFRTIDHSDQWSFGLLTSRTNDHSDHYPSDQWPFGLMTLRTIDHSDQWPFGLLTIRTNDHSEYRPVTVMLISCIWLIKCLGNADNKHVDLILRHLRYSTTSYIRVPQFTRLHIQFQHSSHPLDKILYLFPLLNIYCEKLLLKSIFNT